MSSLWDVPQYLIMAFSLALDAPVEKASRVSLSSPPAQHTTAAAAASLPDENFWLRSVKLASPSSDILSAYGARIFVTSTGRYYVPAESERADILALRRNGEVTARVLAAATWALRKRLQTAYGRIPTRGALLIAHLASETAALDYMAALDADPEAEAARAVPALTKLLDGNKTMTLAQLETRLSRSLRAEPQQVATARASGDPEALKGTLTRPEDRANQSAQVARR